ncbi:MAG: hypothetical protein J3K34DRAFT_525166 [Monoraphidium minutum]|nr:MAG: hypothetical protein J3K34DRAFT_525166 [Monoraphidium minutum]
MALRSALGALRPSGLARLQAFAVAHEWGSALELASTSGATRGLNTGADAPAPAPAAGAAAAGGGAGGPIYAAVVLERLPVARGPPPEWEADYMAWAEARRLARGFYKEYPAQAKKQRQKDDDADSFKPVPIETPADRSGDVRTMKRSLREKLVLLVKQNGSALGPSRGGGGGGGSGGGGWAFPHVAAREGEAVRAAAERALREAAGPAEAFFIGNAPMAHYPLPPHGGGGGGGASSGKEGSGSGGGGGARALHTSAAVASSSGDGGGSGGGAVFFMLAQVVNDPWDLDLSPAFGSDHAWVAAGELGDYLGDDRLVELARKMI